MPVIRCPACNKPNPDFLDVCQYCETPLTPAGLAGAGSALPGEGSPASQTTEGTSPETSAPEAAGSAAVEAGDEAEPEAEAPPPPDWLSRLRGVGSEADETEKVDQPGRQAEPHWIWTGPGDEAGGTLPEESLTAAGEAEPAANLPEWLSAPPPASEPPSSQLPASWPDRAQDSQPLWMRGEAVEDAAASAAGPGEPGDVPEWMTAGSPEGTATGKAADDEVDTTPWLRPYRAEAPVPKEMLDAADDQAAPQPPAEEAAPAGAEGLPDWLQPGAGLADADIPDWLKPFQAPEGATAPPEPAPLDSASNEAEAAPGEPERPKVRMTDWLRAKGPPPDVTAPAEAPASQPSQLPAPEVQANAGPEAAPAEASTMPDWLRALHAERADDSVGAAEESPLAPETQPAETPTPTGPRKKMTDRMAWPPGGVPDTAGSEPAGEAEAPEAGTEPPAELPEWLTAMQREAQELPGWLGQESAPPSGEPPAATPVQDSEVPDWLKALRAAQAPAAPLPAAAAPQGRAQEFPDWLKPAAANNVPHEQAARLAAEAKAEAETAAEAAAEAELEAEAGPGTAAPVEAAAASQAEVARPAEPEAAARLPAPSGEMPDWLRAAAPSAEGVFASQHAEMPELDAETLEWLGSLTAAAPAAEQALAEEPATPASLDELAAASAASQAGESASDETPAAVPTPVEEMPDWLRTLRGVPAGEQRQPEAPPDWLRTLRGMAATEATTQAAAAAEAARPPAVETLAAAQAAPAEAEVKARATVEPEAPIAAEPPAPAAAPAALPAWLAAMRPEDAEKALAEEDAYEESVGVLAGMRGVLRAEPVVARPHTITTPVQKLAVAETHAAHARLLAELIDEENAVAQAPARRLRQAARLVERWVVFALLALAILVTQFALPNLFAAPDAISRDALAAFEVVENVDPDRPALIAFDYDPALQGEINPGASIVATHLMQRGVPVVGVSTRPTGAAVGNAVLGQAAAALTGRTGQAYTAGTDYLNLGYVPGGPVGLLRFASAPRDLIHSDFTGDLTSPALWDAPAVASINRLSDFGLVVVVAGTPDAARAWLEQARAYLQGVPMVAVVSAGADPMVRPYREGEAPQLAGLIAGLAQAAQYEQVAGLPGTAVNRSAALGGGLLAAMLLIAGGNALNSLLGIVRRKP